MLGSWYLSSKQRLLTVSLDAPRSYGTCRVFRTPAGDEGKEQDAERKQKCTDLVNVTSPSAVSSAGFPGPGRQDQDCAVLLRCKVTAALEPWL